MSDPEPRADAVAWIEAELSRPRNDEDADEDAKWSVVRARLAIGNPSKAAMEAAERIFEDGCHGHVVTPAEMAAAIDEAMEPERKAAARMLSAMQSHARPRIGGMVGQIEVDEWDACQEAYRAARSTRPTPTDADTAAHSEPPVESESGSV